MAGYQETKLKVTYVHGKIPIKNIRGGVSYAKGVRTPGNGIIVQANNFQASSEQIADHEAYHGLKQVYGQ